MTQALSSRRAFICTGAAALAFSVKPVRASSHVLQAQKSGAVIGHEERFRAAIIASLRSDPDAIWIGPIKNQATTDLALEAAEAAQRAGTRWSTEWLATKDLAFDVARGG